MAKNIVILVRQEGLGSVAPEDGPFGLEMMDRFLHTLERPNSQPKAICFYTLGVKLACQGSKAIFGLKMLQGMGVQLLICKTCLEYYGLLDKVAVGEVRGMAEISQLLMEADQVITI